MSLRVAFSGKFGSGKDTAADVLKQSDAAPRHYLFAKRVKEVVATLTGTSYEFNCSDEGKRTIPPGFTKTLGELQQFVGQGFCDQLGEDIWVNIVLAQVQAQEESCVITDLRYPNEANALKEAGFLLVRINVEGPTLERRTKGDKINRNHPSETALDDYAHFDVMLENNGTKEEFEEQVRQKILKK